MDELRQALAESEHHYLTQDMKTIVAAARRFLALTETGPDYEAAEVVLERQLADEDNFYIDSATKVVVDAALADYLVSTEGET